MRRTSRPCAKCWTRKAGRSGLCRWSTRPSAELSSGEWSLVIVNIAMIGLTSPVYLTLRELALAPAVEEGKVRARVLFVVPESAAVEALPVFERERLPYVAEAIPIPRSARKGQRSADGSGRAGQPDSPRAPRFQLVRAQAQGRPRGPRIRQCLRRSATPTCSPNATSTS